MPKDRSSRVASYESRRARGSPYFSSHGRSSGSRRSEESCDAAAKQAAEWEEVRCPVCMDHPHNAVLLVCSSHEKGCRPFMCDTSSRHSNCYDQYRKASKETSKEPEGAAAAAECSECQQQVKLSCPLCRGPVSDCIKDYDARRYMNSKVRSCTTESCEFKGAYHELRKHARVEHPAARPMEVDPERQRDWCRMEQQRDLGDLISMLYSGLSSGLEDAVLGAAEEGEEGVAMRAARPSIMVLIMRSSGSIQQYLSGSRRRSTIILLSQALGERSTAGASGSGADADVAAPDSEEGDDPAPTAGSQHDPEEEEEDADGDPTQ
uniref:Uncharacterized protein n=1 Tax=Arundo donax TaxID=35708 RepID=A0A0A9D152_ARUDO